MGRTINHIDLTVTDLDRSRAFYESILKYLGFRISTCNPGILVFPDSDGTSITSIALQPAKPENRDKRHNRYAPGLHHLAFNATSRDDVDGLYKILKRLGAEVTDPPAVYYEPDYYATFFLDPDGIKLEFAYTPSSE